MLCAEFFPKKGLNSDKSPLKTVLICLSVNLVVVAIQNILESKEQRGLKVLLAHLELQHLEAKA